MTAPARETINLAELVKCADAATPTEGTIVAAINVQEDYRQFMEIVTPDVVQRLVAAIRNAACQHCLDRHADRLGAYGITDEAGTP